MTLPEKGYKKIAVITFYIFLGIVCAYVFFKYLFVCILPFGIAFVISSMLKRPVEFMCKKLKFKKYAAVLLTTFGILFAVMAVLRFLLSGILSEFSEFADYLSSNRILSSISGIYESVSAFSARFLPFLSEHLDTVFEYAAKNIDILITSITDKLLPYLAGLAVKIIRYIPNITFFCIVTLISVFYFGCDYDRIVHFIKSQFSEKSIRLLCELKKQFFVTALGIIRAYVILMTLTFIELWVGFSILQIPYATLLSFLIAVIDVLPVLGTGTILIPWGILNLVTGNIKTGLCILALYAIITVIRQIAEPKIMGDSVGLHPLATLISMYFGIKLAGISGLFIFPLTVIIIKNLNEKELIRLYKNPEPSKEQTNLLARKKLKSFKAASEPGKE